MKTFNKTIIRAIFYCFGSIYLIGLSGCAHLERPFTYHEFDGMFVYYKTQDVRAYRELLPKEFDMPDEPFVMVFVMDYYKMDKATQPYLEAAVFLLVKHKNQTGWHCVTMPVTSDEARIGGIKYLGFPKIMGDVNFIREPSSYIGTFSLNNKNIITVKLSPHKNKEISPDEEGWLKKLLGLPNFNLLDGKVYSPEFGFNINILRANRWFPDRVIIKTGTASISQYPDVAGNHSARLAKIFSIKPAEIVLAYYFKNTFTVSFGAGNYQ
jgi:acetoacetate decarboxylase